MNVVNKILFKEQRGLEALKDSRCGVEERLRERIGYHLEDAPLEALVVLDQALAVCDGVYGLLCVNDLMVALVAACAEFNTPHLESYRVEALCGVENFRQNVGELLEAIKPQSIKKVDVMLKEAA